MQQPYTSTDLQEFKILIESKIEQAQKEYNLIKDTLSKHDNSARDTNWSANMMEDGRESLSQEEAHIVLQKHEKFITALKQALVRIGNKSYGVCMSTGQIIPKGRLLAVPHTTTCIAVKNID